MSDYGDLVELAFEGLDKATDKYHDVVYSGISHAPGWVKRRASFKKRKKDRSSSVPATDDRLWQEENRRPTQADRARGRSTEVTEVSRERYEPPPFSNGAPRPVYGNAPIPPQYSGDDQYRMSGALQPDYRRSRGALHPDDGYYDDERRRPRARSMNSRRDDYYEEPRGRHSRRSSRNEKDFHIGAALAGGAAGAFIGHEAGKGDTLQMGVGALLGAITASVAEKQYEKHKERSRERMDAERDHRRDRRSGARF